MNPEITKALDIAVTVAFDSATVCKSSRNETVVQIITDYSCTDDLGHTLEGSIVENEVINKQTCHNR